MRSRHSRSPGCSFRARETAPTETPVSAMSLIRNRFRHVTLIDLRWPFAPPARPRRVRRCCHRVGLERSAYVTVYQIAACATRACKPEYSKADIGYPTAQHDNIGIERIHHPRQRARRVLIAIAFHNKQASASPDSTRCIICGTPACCAV